MPNCTTFVSIIKCTESTVSLSLKTVQQFKQAKRRVKGNHLTLHFAGTNTFCYDNVSEVTYYVY